MLLKPHCGNILVPFIKRSTCWKSRRDEGKDGWAGNGQAAYGCCRQTAQYREYGAPTLFASTFGGTIVVVITFPPENVRITRKITVSKKSRQAGRQAGVC